MPEAPMLARRSALASFKPIRSAAVSMGEVRGFTLTQAAVFSRDAEAAIAAVTGPLPTTATTAQESNGRIIFRTAPLQFWLVGPEGDDIAQRLAGTCIVTPLSHSRSRIFVEGTAAREIMRKGMPLDFHEAVFAPGMFAMTGLHHTPVLVHCAAPNRFELYAMRTFAANIWEWLEDAALEFTA
ncbi:MAG TPA: sarcosine oxidase subunit gamma family protein [Dongiaceae bacterium]|nr:sarcosine oxidase subunit gamma family protein [Dongiaceae bacterium]